jgi:hypothetical protein
MVLNIKPLSESVVSSEVKFSRLVYRRGSGKIILEIQQANQWNGDPGKVIIRMYCGNLGRYCKVQIKIIFEGMWGNEDIALFILNLSLELYKFHISKQVYS